MKRMLPLLLSALLLALALPAMALAFGEPTPPTGNSESGGADNTTDKTPQDTQANNSNNTTTNTNTQNNTTTNTADTPAGSGGQGGGAVIDQYVPGAYATELNLNQQIIEEAQQQYGGPRLSGLSVGGLALIPAFNAETFYYTAYVPEEQASVTISVSTPASGGVYIDGVAGSTRQIAVGSGERTVRVIITESNSSTTYSILLLRQQQIQALPQPVQQPGDFPVLTHVRLDNDEFFYEQDIVTGGGDIYIALPAESRKSFDITLSANIEVLAYCDNVRVYNVVYNTQAGAWQWKRQYIGMSSKTETRLEIFLADKKNMAVQNTYTLILQQPAESLNIQLQVGNEQALVNSTVHDLDAPPVILEGHTMVPLRFIAEALGAQVSWDSSQRRVELNLDGQTLELFIGQLSDGMPQAPFISNGYTMVPLRYVSERLNCQVEWVAATREIIITK